MVNNSNLNNVFVWVPSAQVETYKAGVGLSSDTYKKKIAFLEGTGEIMTQGVVFALNKTSDIEDLQDLIGVNTSFANGISATTVIGFLNELKGYIDTNTNAIGNSSSGLTKRVGDLETSVDTATTGLKDRMTAAENTLTTLQGNSEVSGSIDNKISTAIAGVVNNAPAAFDTLKEIADWIGSGDVASTTAATMLGDISTLKTKVGDEGTPAELYTAEDEAQDPTHVAGTEKTPAVASTGIYAAIDDLQEQIDSMTGGAGSISTQINTAIGNLDGSVTLQGTTLSQPSNVTRNSSIDVLGSVTVVETDGVLVQNSSSYIVLQADAAGAAADVYTTLLGTAADASDGTAYTIHGVQNYAKSIVDSKNVQASGDTGQTALVTASASNNTVTVESTQYLRDAVQLANSALQSVTIASTDSDLLSVAATPNTPGGVTLDVQTGTLATGTTTNVTADTTNGKLATVDNIATAINGITLWETYTTE